MDISDNSKRSTTSKKKSITLSEFTEAFRKKFSLGFDELQKFENGQKISVETQEHLQLIDLHFKHLKEFSERKIDTEATDKKK